ncbi:MAG: HtaA domain-containing protein [Solirubrobacterales bacterium]
MDASELTKTAMGRAGALALAALALVAAMAALAAPARGAAAQGGAEIRLAQHEQGRTLSGQGVEIIPGGGGATAASPWLKLPIDSVDPGAEPWAGSPAWLRFQRGARSVALTDLRFDLKAGTLNGRLGGEQIAIFRQGAASSVDPGAGSVSVQDGKLHLIREAATLLRDRLGLERALVGKGVGMIWLAARADPTRVEHPVVSGGAEWGVLTSLRKYVLGHQGPPPPIVPPSNGTITVAGGASADGDLSAAGAFFAFPADGGSFGQGLYGASDRLVLHTQGSVTFAKPAHCIIEIELAEIAVRLDGADSALELDSLYDIDAPEGGGCAPLPPVATDDVEFAELDLSAVAPVYSAGGKTVTWSAIPAELTAAGAAAFGAGYPEGQQLDPVTVSVGLG